MTYKEVFPFIWIHFTVSLQSISTWASYLALIYTNYLKFWYIYSRILTFFRIFWYIRNMLQFIWEMFSISATLSKWKKIFMAEQYSIECQDCSLRASCYMVFHFWMGWNIGKFWFCTIDFNQVDRRILSMFTNRKYFEPISKQMTDSTFFIEHIQNQIQSKLLIKYSLQTNKSIRCVQLTETCEILKMFDIVTMFVFFLIQKVPTVVFFSLYQKCRMRRHLYWYCR